MKKIAIALMEKEFQTRLEVFLGQDDQSSKRQAAFLINSMEDFPIAVRPDGNVYLIGSPTVQHQIKPQVLFELESNSDCTRCNVWDEGGIPGEYVVHAYSRELSHDWYNVKFAHGGYRHQEQELPRSKISADRARILHPNLVLELNTLVADTDDNTRPEKERFLTAIANFDKLGAYIEAKLEFNEAGEVVRTYWLHVTEVAGLTPLEISKRVLTMMETCHETLRRRLVWFPDTVPQFIYCGANNGKVMWHTVKMRVQPLTRQYPLNYDPTLGDGALGSHWQ